MQQNPNNPINPGAIPPDNRPPSENQPTPNTPSPGAPRPTPQDGVEADGPAPNTPTPAAPNAPAPAAPNAPSPGEPSPDNAPAPGNNPVTPDNGGALPGNGSLPANTPIPGDTENQGSESANTSAAAESEAQKDSAGDGKHTLMLIEDDPFLHKILTDKLSAQPEYEVLDFIDAESALEKLQEQKPDLILLDLILPSMGGFDFLEKIKADAETKDIPVIILSNLGQQSDIERGKELGAIDFMIKAQFTLDEILKKIAAVFSG